MKYFVSIILFLGSISMLGFSISKFGLMPVSMTGTAIGMIFSGIRILTGKNAQ